MPAAPRHSKPRKPATKLGVSIVAAAALASVAAAFVYLTGASAAPRSAHQADALAVARLRTVSGMAGDHLTMDFRKAIAGKMAKAATHARHRYLAARAARRARLAARRRAARRQAAQQAAAQAQPASHQQAKQPSTRSPAPARRP